MHDMYISCYFQLSDIGADTGVAPAVLDDRRPKRAERGAYRPTGQCGTGLLPLEHRD